ncbi:hypothetical protein Bca52824_044207 [Brassica carinata]|uniref:Uncharacterized protein n=1 Tax=Brassica carinata TaxID=52824 RepID=A0A8X7S0F3_BRACI|nr:hypothetical protein Bca52824_044207 [Brassica carinata]
MCASEFVDERRSLSYSELWAGPTYSNSPPSTSVPIPKFSLRQRRTVSLTFPSPDSAVDVLKLLSLLLFLQPHLVTTTTRSTVLSLLL